jgi:hypothetical protein
MLTFLCFAAGWKAMGKNALIGGVLLALIEGMGIMLMKLSAKAQSTCLAPCACACLMIAAGGSFGNAPCDVQMSRGAVLDTKLTTCHRLLARQSETFPRWAATVATLSIWLKNL